MSAPPSDDRLPVVIIACQVMESLLGHLLPPGLARDVQYMDYGLHRFPTKMTWTLQDAVDAVEEPSLIVLGYGLCGNGLNGIQAGKHTLLIPRVDDCIAILLGSRRRYLEEFESEPGTYYLSKGWLESGSHPLKEYEEYVEKYGPEDAAWIMDQQYAHYERLVLVTHDEADLETYRPQAHEVAAYCDGIPYCHLPIDPASPTAELHWFASGLSARVNRFEAWSLKPEMNPVPTANP